MVHRRRAPRSAPPPGCRDQLGYPLGPRCCRPTPSGSGSAVAFALGGVGPDDPDRCAAGLIGLLSAVAAYYLLFARPRRGLPGHRRAARGHDLGRRRAPAGPVMGGAGAVWRHGTGWPRAIGVASSRRRCSARASSSAAPRLDRGSTSCAHDPGALLFSPRSSSASRCRSSCSGAASGSAATWRRSRSRSSPRSPSARSRRVIRGWPTASEDVRRRHRVRLADRHA